MKLNIKSIMAKCIIALIETLSFSALVMLLLNYLSVNADYLDSIAVYLLCRILFFSHTKISELK